MLSEKKMLDKLYAQPKIFNEHIRHKEYAQASYCVHCARIIALFMELSEPQLEELFGSKQDPENVVDGLFSEEKILRAEEWCIFHNQTRQDMTRKDRAERERVWRENNLPAKEYLTRLKTIDKEIATICKEIALLNENVTPSGAQMEVCASRTNAVTRPTENKALKLQEKEEALRKQLESYREEYVDLKTTATRLIAKIKHTGYQMVLYKYYLHDMTLHQTAEEMGKSYQRVCAIRDKAIAEFQRLMDEEGIKYD